MCGIAGFTRFFHSVGEHHTLEKMGQAIRHRGPDASGVYLNDNIGLCHQRLSIIDLSEAGNQPMLTKDKRYSYLMGRFIIFLNYVKIYKKEGINFILKLIQKLF
jgi:asparagine synthase (glutamine-hydrolysing)